MIDQMSGANAEQIEGVVSFIEKSEDEIMAELPEFLRCVPTEFWGPEWWRMDDGDPAVYALNIERSIRAGKALIEESYCMTQYFCGLIDPTCRVWADHTWEIGLS